MSCDHCSRPIPTRKLHYLLADRSLLCGRCVDDHDRYDNVVAMCSAASVPIMRHVVWGGAA